MYDFLDGVVAERAAARLVLAVAGVGYEIAVPPGTAPDLRPGGSGRLYVHLHVSDGTPRLFGFGTREERDLFRLILGVSGVGPATGLALLSAVPPAELVRAIAEEDAPALRRVRGVGEKTARRLVLELKGKVEAAPAADRTASDAASALVSLGFNRREAEQAVARAARESGPPDLESLVRRALSSAGRAPSPAG
ncbi:MAG TPA: Holliday junction branch migration protein RuvA [Planctomycetota bacterium]|nr:Holliday junction branch migration protein RuvA [Planctomycetota bacterium]